MFTFEEVLDAYRRMYGDKVWNPEFESFEAAFRAAWRSFDFISGAETLEDFAQGMTDCWQLNIEL